MWLQAKSSTPILTMESIITTRVILKDVTSNSLDRATLFKNVATGQCLDSNGEGNVYGNAPNCGDFKKWRIKDLEKTLLFEQFSYLISKSVCVLIFIQAASPTDEKDFN